MAWLYDASARLYRNAKTGRAVTRRQLMKLRNDLADQAGAEMQSLTQHYVSGDIRIDQWAAGFAALIAAGATAGYLLGKGGRNAIDAWDNYQIDQIIAKQKPFAQNFVRELGSGQVSDAQALDRAGRYNSVAIHGFEKAQWANFDPNSDLPNYPGDGSTECMDRCRCEWDITEEEDHYTCIWQTVEDTGVCETCKWRGENWAPLTVGKNT